MNKIEMGKQYRTRDGMEVRIYATDGGDGTCVHGAYRTNEGWWLSSAWHADGRYSISDYKNDFDLIEVKRRIKRDVWLNVYEDDNYGDCYPTKELADKYFDSRRIACVKLTIDVEEGEGL